MVLSRVFIQIMIICLCLALVAKAQVEVFDVTKYGAVSDGHTDNTKAFLRAWGDACEAKRKAIVHIPTGTFLVGSVAFSGPCKNPVVFRMKGVLKAPTDLDSMESGQWIAFRYVNRLEVTGGGTLDGQGRSAWSQNNCLKDPNCKELPISMIFDFVTDSRVHHITLLDSKAAHFSIFACRNVNVSKVRISAPGDSPNTDGIKIGSSDRIRISTSRIATGDDCVALLSGSSKIYISNVLCGPGHGISIGSLGRNPNEKNVVGVTVKNCTFTNTTNGLRIKSWPSSMPNLASSITYKNIYMNNVQNPIVIDQRYCPAGGCQQTPSHVQVKDVTYTNIWGVSTTKDAVNFQCSPRFPCKNIRLKDINLVHRGPGGPASSFCSYVNGASSGRQNPPSCV